MAVQPWIRFTLILHFLIIERVIELFCLCVTEYEQSVRIKLTDMNDEIPRFVNLPRPFLATVSANAAPGTSVYQLMAQDDDEESLVRYILESGMSLFNEKKHY